MTRQKWCIVQLTYQQWKKSGESGKISLLDEDVKALNDYIGFQSYIVNEKLRTGTPLTESEEEFANKLDSALDKLPKYEGNLTRSLEFYTEDDVKEFVLKHEKDVPICYNQYIGFNNCYIVLPLFTNPHKGKNKGKKIW